MTRGLLANIIRRIILPSAVVISSMVNSPDILEEAFTNVSH